MISRNDFIDMYHKASPEIQEAIKQLLELQEFTPKETRQVLITCKVAPDIIATFDKAYDIRTA